MPHTCWLAQVWRSIEVLIALPDVCRCVVVHGRRILRSWCLLIFDAWSFPSSALFLGFFTFFFFISYFSSEARRPPAQYHLTFFLSVISYWFRVLSCVSVLIIFIPSLSHSRCFLLFSFCCCVNGWRCCVPCSPPPFLPPSRSGSCTVLLFAGPTLRSSLISAETFNSIHSRRAVEMKQNFFSLSLCKPAGLRWNERREVCAKPRSAVPFHVVSSLIWGARNMLRKDR